MNKLKLLLTGILLVILSGCYSAQDIYQHRPREVYTPYRVYDEYPYSTSVFINYNFYCPYCFYETYYCFNCHLSHVRINHWCNHHYNWYYNWYRVNYYQSYGYYHTHYTEHYYYRGNSRYYTRDRHGIKRSDNRSPVIKNKKRNRDDFIKRYKPFIKYKSPGERNKIYKQNPPVRKNKTYKKDTKIRQNTKQKTKQKNTKEKK